MRKGRGEGRKAEERKKKGKEAAIGRRMRVKERKEREATGDGTRKRGERSRTGRDEGIKGRQRKEREDRETTRGKEQK